MKRIMIIGCCGAGKSTLARNLHDIIGINVIHLDQHYHLPNWGEPDKNEWQQKVEKLISEDKWIMDGNYGGTMDQRLARADTVIYLKYSAIRCLYRVIKRTFKYYGKARPNMAEGCAERFDLEFLHYVAVLNMVKGKGILKKLSALPSSKTVFTLHNDKEVRQWLNTVIKEFHS